jgi:hypothetical protein
LSIKDSIQKFEDRCSNLEETVKILQARVSELSQEPRREEVILVSKEGELSK